MELDATLPNADLTRVPKVPVALPHQVNDLMCWRFTFYNTKIRSLHAKLAELNLQ